MDMQTVEKLLTTTRSVRRRLDLDRPVERGVIQKCIEWAIQSPTGSNAQGWHFMVITDPAKKAAIAEHYHFAWERYSGAASKSGPNPFQTIADSAEYLAKNLARVPVLIIPCIEGRIEDKPYIVRQAGFYGSILPAAWSLMLALRAHGLGSAYTTFHLRNHDEVSELLGIPPHVTQAALLPVAYYTGEDFKPAKRKPAESLTYWESWGETVEREDFGG